MITLEQIRRILFGAANSESDEKVVLPVPLAIFHVTQVCTLVYSSRPRRTAILPIREKGPDKGPMTDDLPASPLVRKNHRVSMTSTTQEQRGMDSDRSRQTYVIASYLEYSPSSMLCRKRRPCRRPRIPAHRRRAATHATRVQHALRTETTHRDVESSCSKIGRHEHCHVAAFEPSEAQCTKLGQAFTPYRPP